MDFGAGVADAGLEGEEGETRGAGGGEARVGEEGDGEGVGLRVVGEQEGEEGGFAGAVGAKDAPALTAANGPVQAAAGEAVDGLGPVAEDGFAAVGDGDVVHFDYGFAGWRGGFAAEGKAFSAIAPKALSYSW